MDAIRLLSLEQETILSLISTVVSGAHDVRLKAEICWVKVMEEATRQGVQGLCFDALELLPAEQRPDKAILMDWFGQVVCLESLYGIGQVTGHCPELFVNLQSN